MMKIRILLLSFFSFAFYLQVNSQAREWFNVTELFPGVFRIDDHGAVNVYLVVGKDSALVIDTGMGNADLVSTVEKLTKKPLIVVNTHGHPDHTGANYQFKKIYIHPYDINDAVANNDPEKRRQAASVMQAGAKPTESELFKGKPEQTRLVPVRDGYIFRLGDRNLKVIETPGHTAGEIVILDIENKLLFAGDNDNTLVWLFLPDCKPLHEYLASLIKLQGMRNEFTTILPGHGIARSSDFIDDQVKCVKGILDGSLKTEPYKSFAGEAMMATFGKASVAFNPKNL